MLGEVVTVNGVPLLAKPLTVTTTLPALAPPGTVTMMLVPCVAPKFVPVIVTDLPTGPEAGFNDVHLASANQTALVGDVLAQVEVQELWPSGLHRLAGGGENLGFHAASAHRPHHRPVLPHQHLGALKAGNRAAGLDNGSQGALPPQPPEPHQLLKYIHPLELYQCGAGGSACRRCGRLSSVRGEPHDRPANRNAWPSFCLLESWPHGVSELASRTVRVSRQTKYTHKATAQTMPNMPICRWGRQWLPIIEAA
jgi:hypothetical protein